MPRVRLGSIMKVGELERTGSIYPQSTHFVIFIWIYSYQSTLRLVRFIFAKGNTSLKLTMLQSNTKECDWNFGQSCFERVARHRSKLFYRCSEVKKVWSRSPILESCTDKTRNLIWLELCINFWIMFEHMFRMFVTAQDNVPTLDVQQK